MSDRRDFYYRQKVTEGELDAAFDALEAADRTIIKDLGFTGVASGLAVSQHAGVADLTVDVTLGTAHDPDGQRIRIPTGQTVNLAVDSNSVSTAVAGAPNARVVSLFAVFARALSDPRIDGNSNTVYFVRAESFAFRVVMGNEALLGTEVAPALAADAILLADVRRTFGQTQILNAQINPYTPNRRQVFDFGVDTADVNTLISAALAAAPTITNAVLTGNSTRITATKITANGHARGSIISELGGADTTGATPAMAFSWPIVDEAVTIVNVQASAIRTDGVQTASFQRRCRIKRDGGTVTVGAVEDLGSDRDGLAAGATTTIDNSGSTGRVMVTGVAATNLNWFVVVERIEHTHP